MKFNRVLLSLTIGVSLSIVFYLMGSFANSTFEISKWGIASRDFIGMFMGLSFIIGSLITYFNHKEF